ncbi:ferritin-like domain-containing protein [Pseudenhygromyxa sp. WMMC2535]|uniref:ferritin-like domain-containing protein n=1 Tax=Pseudenhygromyxa sp. WMMC2535 TaxID=2712867 RepID=UPI0015517E3A|nr:ferritin-like domain-containing protein [Pseudenhygromyxa sp. WMMC2535]NVB41009.1 ferritin-like domain-containing protein [Pseudenhygromyxa sp. WMMC2535]
MRTSVTELRVLRMALLAALGFDLAACADDSSSDDEGSSGSGPETSGEGESAESESGSTGSDAESGSAESDSESSSTDSADTETDSTDTGVDPYTCEDPQPILQAGTELPSGFVTCADGFVHRVEAVECAAPQPADDETCDGVVDAICQTGDDCTAQGYAACKQDMWGQCTCQYGCASDDDCDAGEICACAGVFDDQPSCIPADCTADAECGQGLCGLSKYEGCCDNSYHLACAAPDEACHTNADCGAGSCLEDVPEPIVDYQCSESEGAWTCGPPGWCGCDCGRPLMIDGQPRVAGPSRRADASWMAVGIEPELRELDASLRAQLAARWAEIGRFEHASVASFARFAAQLQALGAPPALLRETAAAMADEVEHAKLAFALAAAYAGAPVGPGRLDLRGAGVSARAQLVAAQIVDALIVEACVGETLAALEALEAARWAEDPSVRAILTRIADDELRHARLGWRALAWLLERGGDQLRTAASRTFTLTMAKMRAEPEAPPAERASSLLAHGHLDAALRQQVRARGLAEVVAPAARAALSPSTKIRAASLA